MNKNIEIGKRIKIARENSKLTQQELGNILGLNKSSIQRYETGKISKIKIPILENIAVALNVNPYWLILEADDPTYHGERLSASGPLIKNINNTMYQEFADTVFLPEKNIRMIPLYESVSAGFGTYASGDIIDNIPMYIESDYEARKTLCIKVKGDSMYPKIEDGDIIQVRKQDIVENGQIAAVMIDKEEGLVKRLFYGNDYIRLESINPAYPPITFRQEEMNRVKIVGVVKKVIKEL